jgi:RNA polymerase sigma factor (sigma-70 family)
MQQQRSPQANTSLVALLYQRHASTIFLSVRRHIFSLEDAEDITLEVFLAALEQEELLTGMSDDVRIAWLRRVAHNKIVDHYRRSAHRQATTLEEVISLLDDENSEPELMALRSEEYALLRRHLATLSPQQQKILHLRFAGGLRSREIASLLNKREGSVRSMLARSLNFLRSAYERSKEV